MEPNYQPPQQGGPVLIAPYKLAATTEGKPFLFGMIGSGLLLVVYLMSIPGILAGAALAGLAGMLDVDAGLFAGGFLFGAILTLALAFLVYPGIYLILLLRGKTVPRRTKTFAIVWIVLTGLGLLFGLTNLFTLSGFFSFAGNLLILLSCVFLLQKLKVPPMVAPVAPMTPPAPPTDYPEQ